MAELKYLTVANEGELAEGQSLPIEVDGEPIAVFLVDGQYYAVEDRCPHQGAPLCDGIIDKKEIACSWHGWRFSLEDGRRLDNPRGKVAVYPVRVEGGEIQVGFPAA